MKNLKIFLMRKKVIFMIGILALISLSVFGYYQSRYFKAEKPKKVEMVVYNHPKFERDPFFEDIDNHFNHIWRNVDFSFPEIKVVHQNIPRVDMIENEKSLEIIAEFPGIKKEEINISIQNEYLILEAKSQKKNEEKKKNYHLRERQYGFSKRVLRLPYYVNTQKATSVFENGILTISIPKKEKMEMSPKNIEIQ
ncbi:MAG: Hsp20/alpha crystallin family protein [Alphaproteobacteria bacterium]|nr:Hsp20/alpha crystallin family protein [Alphaproteobacteria bacterium]